MESPSPEDAPPPLEEHPRPSHTHGIRSSKILQEFSALMPTSTLLETSKLTFKFEEARLGQKDLAELRTDRTGTYYSNFTPQGLGPESAAAWLGTNWAWCISMALFFWCALRNLVFNHEAGAMALTGCFAVFVCSEKVLDWRFSMEKSAVFVGLIFPLVFLIGQTWGRREQASGSVSAMRANGVQFVLKLMVGSGPGGHADSKGRAEKARHAVGMIKELFEQILHYMPQDSHGSLVRITRIYGIFEDMISLGDPTLVRFLVADFEKLRQIRNYRTPWRLNYFVFFFSFAAPVVLAPMFASVGCEDRNPARFPTEGEDCGYGKPGAYLSMVFFAVLLAALLAVVKALEDPFSLDGTDDIVCQFDIESNALEKLIEDRVSAGHTQASTEDRVSAGHTQASTVELSNGTQERAIGRREVLDEDDELVAGATVVI